MNYKTVEKQVHISYLPYKEDGRRKLKEEDIENIRKLFIEGKGVIELSEVFSVCPDTIKYWTNENYRLATIQRTKKRVSSNPESSKRTRKKFKQRYIERQRRDFEENKTIRLKWMREYRKNNREQINLKHNNYVKERIKKDKNFHDVIKKWAMENYYKYHTEKNKKHREYYELNKIRINKRRKMLYEKNIEARRTRQRELYLLNSELLCKKQLNTTKEKELNTSHNSTFM